MSPCEIGARVDSYESRDPGKQKLDSASSGMTIWILEALLQSSSLVQVQERRPPFLGGLLSVILQNTYQALSFCLKRDVYLKIRPPVVLEF